MDGFVPLSELTGTRKRKAFPEWLKKRIPSGYDTQTLDKLARSLFI